MKKGIKIFMICAAVVLDLAVAALLVWEYIKNGQIGSGTLLKAAAVVASTLIMVMRFFLRDNSLNSVKYKKYEEIYSEYIKNAFTRPEQKQQRKELLRAIDNYNSEDYRKALEILDKLKKNCGKVNDSFAVNMFTALCYSDMGLNAKAIEVYNSIVAVDKSNSTVWSNLGLLYVKEGKNRDAESCYKNAIEQDGTNPYPYNNLGTLYLKEFRYDEAIEYAKEALERKNNMYQASNTLAIAYTITGEFDLADKYFKISVANGVDAEGLRRAIDTYCEELD